MLSKFLNNIFKGIRGSKQIQGSQFNKLSFPALNYLDEKKKSELEKILNVRINHVEIFEQALTHRSYLQVSNEKESLSNERLEYLGDAVLNLIVADFLFSIHSDVMEGELTKMRSWLVNKSALAIYAKKIELEKFIQMSFSALKSLEKGSESIVSDTLEAIIGAIYIDSGIIAARKFITENIIPVIMNKTEMVDKNYKSIYLEFIQSKGFSSPTYRVLEESGPDHEKIFVVGVYVNNELMGVGEGKSKKQAEQIAAERAVKNSALNDDKNME